MGELKGCRAMGTLNILTLRGFRLAETPCIYCSFAKDEPDLKQVALPKSPKTTVAVLDNPMSAIVGNLTGLRRALETNCI